MVEFGIRLVIAAAIVFVSGAFDSFPFDLAWKACAALSALAFVGQRLEARGLLNPGFSGILAVGDAFVVAMLLGASGYLDTLGFLVLLPVIYAAAQRQAPPASMAPLAAVSLFVSYSVFAKSATPSPILLVQVGGVLAAGLTLNLFKPRPLPAVVGDRPSATQAVIPDGYIELRESYRKLKQSYQDLDKKARKPMILTELDALRSVKNDGFFKLLAQKLKALLGVDGVGLYVLAQFEGVMVVRGVSGVLGQKLNDSAVTVDLDRALGQVRWKAGEALKALRDPDDARTLANVILTDRGKMLGMVCLLSEDEGVLDEATAIIEDLAPSLGAFIAEHFSRDNLERRVNQAEMLYETACVAQGATTRLTLCDRLVGQLNELCSADHVSLTLIEDGRAEPLCTKGVPMQPLDLIRMDSGNGIEGWVAAGYPELSIFDLRADTRFDNEEAVRQRIGALCVSPVIDETGCLGFMTVATHRVGGLQGAEMEVLRVTAAELGRALSRLSKADPGPEGIMAAMEFYDFVNAHPGGCIILLEPLKREQLEESFGKPALGHAFRQLGVRLRSKLPAGGALCRKPDGEFIVYMPTANEQLAVQWANDAAATASFIGLKTPEGGTRIPLGMRAKVAKMDKQEDEILTLEAS